MGTRVICRYCIKETEPGRGLNLRRPPADAPKNIVYFEGLGNAAFYSLNFEKLIFKGTGFRDYLRVGLGIKSDTDWSYLSPDKSNLEYNMPIMFINESGIKKIKLEMGIGILLAYGEPIRRLNIVSKIASDSYSYGLTGSLGMRYTLQKIPLFLKLYYTPIYAVRDNTFVWFWIGAGVGYAF